MKSSINIKYDIGNTSLFNDYFATSSHTELIRGVLEGIISNANVNSHIVFGPYGSGKSYVSVILANILSKSISNKQINSLSEKFSDVDLIVNKMLKDYIKKSKKKYLIVKLNGYEGEFNISLLNSLYDTLQTNGYKDLIPGGYKTLESILLRWEKDYPELYSRFFIEISSNEKYMIKSVFLNDLKNGEKEALFEFTRCYENVTGGARLNLENNSNIISVLESVCKELEKDNIGIFIIYDEFGRFLQNLKNEDINLFMQRMQDLAELANNGLQNLSLLFITHKPVGYYFQNSNLDIRSEFAKIEKRYKVYDIKSDYTTFINIVNQQMRDNNLDEEIFLYQKGCMSKYKFFSSYLTDLEVEEKILKKSYPLHPLAVYLLPKISSVFGQNERTLFTFLQDESSNGLKGFMKSHKGYYYSDTLVDYFFINIDKTYIENYKNYILFTNYLGLVNTSVDTIYVESAKRILKFCFLWFICEGNANAKLNTALISYALDIEQSHVDIILELLSNQRIMRFNPIRNYWEIYESSSMDLKEEINKNIYKFSIQDSYLLNLLNQENPYRYIYSKQYNTKYEMTRFADITYVYNNEFGISNADYHFIICFETSLENFSNKDNGMIGILNFPYKKLKNDLVNLYVIRNMKSMQYYNSDKAFYNELEFEEKIILKNLLEFYNLIFTDKCIYDRDILFRSKNDIEIFLDDIFFKIYQKTPLIINDQINMYTITKVQEKAIIEVFDLVLKNHTVELSSFFEGTKPNYLVWYSIYSTNLKEIAKLIRNYVTEISNGEINDLLSLLTTEPYGIRPVVSLLIILFCLSDYLDEIMFYSNDNYIADMNGEFLYDSMIRRKRGISYKFSHFDHENKEFLKGLMDIFSNVGSNVKSKSYTIRACSSMYNWYLELPVITQQKVECDGKKLTLLRTIESSKINPFESLKEIEKMFLSLDEIKQAKQEVEDHFNWYKEVMVNRILQKNKIYNIDQYLTERTVAQIKNNIFLQALDNKKNLIECYSAIIGDLDIERWPLSSFKMIERKIQEDIDSSIEAVDSNTVLVNDKEKAIIKTDLSIKGQTLKHNIKNMINATGKYLTHKEIEQIVYDVFNDYVK